MVELRERLLEERMAAEEAAARLAAAEAACDGQVADKAALLKRLASLERLPPLE